MLSEGQQLKIYASGYDVVWELQEGAHSVFSVQEPGLVAHTLLYANIPAAWWNLIRNVLQRDMVKLKHEVAQGKIYQRVHERKEPSVGEEPIC